MGHSGQLAAQLGTGILQGLNQTIAQNQQLRNAQHTKLMRLAGSGHFDLEPVTGAGDAPDFWQRLFAIPGQANLLQLGPQAYRLVPKTDEQTALASLFTPAEQTRLGLARGIRGAPPFATPPQGGAPTLPQHPQELHFTEPTAAGRLPLDRKTAARLIQDRSERQQRAEATLKQEKLKVLRETRGLTLPDGARQRVREASSMDELIDVMSTIAAAQRASISVANATPARLAMAAAQGNQDAAQALKLLKPEQARVTRNQLARQAAQGNPIAQRAIQILETLKATGVQRRSGQEVSAPAPAQPRPSQPRTTPTPEGGTAGIGTSTLPHIKSFRRIE